MQCLKHLHEDLKYEHLYPIPYVENACMANLNYLTDCPVEWWSQHPWRCSKNM